MKEIIMHDEILGAIGFAVPLLLLAWYANRIRHPGRSWLSAFLILLGGVAVFPGAGFGLGLLWFRTGGDVIQAFVMGGLSPWVGFWLLRRFLRQAPRRRMQAQSETAILEPRRESQDIAELKTEVSALRAEIRAGKS